MIRLSLVLLTALCVQAQRPEYDFYPEGRDKKPEVYAEELHNASAPEKEIARRLDLLRNHRTEMEAGRWDRFYSDSKSNYNLEPNAFLMQVVQGMAPGVVLDYGMATVATHSILSSLAGKFMASNSRK